MKTEETDIAEGIAGFIVAHLLAGWLITIMYVSQWLGSLF